MLIQINTDRHVETSEDRERAMEARIDDVLSRFSERLTRIEVYLSDVNSHKGGDDDNRCVLEARPKGQEPLSVSHQAPSVDLAFEGALDKLTRALDNAFGRRDRF